MTLLLHVTDRREAWLRSLHIHLPGRAIIGLDAAPHQLAEVRHALLWRHPHGHLADLPALEAVFALGAGVDWILADPSLPPNLPVVRLVDAGMAAQLVDWHLYAALHFARDFDRYARDQAEQRWQPRRSPPLRAAMLGLGALGEAVAQALLARGFIVQGWTRRPRSRAFEGHGLAAGLDALPKLLAQTDLLIALLPHTPETAGLLNRERLLALPAGAAIINAGRGSLIDEAALIELLDRGHLRGAFLDVAAEEPPPAGSPLWTHPGVRLTPHVAAATMIVPAAEQIAANIERLERGEAPLGLVDRDAGY